jgi:hypothetical protein
LGETFVNKSFPQAPFQKLYPAVGRFREAKGARRPESFLKRGLRRQFGVDSNLTGPVFHDATGELTNKHLHLNMPRDYPWFVSLRWPFPIE